MREVLRHVLDDGALFPLHEEFGPSVMVGFAHLGGRSVGVVASQPLANGGALDAAASVKAARFVRFCDCFNIPLVTFVDVPGYLPGAAQQMEGVIRHGAKLLYAYAEATVPKLTVVVRKAYGGGYAALGSKHFRADYNVAWPSAEISVMGPRAAAELLHRAEVRASTEPEALLDALESRYQTEHGHPYAAAAYGHVDDVIDPRQTRPRLITALKALAGKRDRNPAKKHGNIPL